MHATAANPPTAADSRLLWWVYGVIFACSAVLGDLLHAGLRKHWDLAHWLMGTGAALWLIGAIVTAAGVIYAWNRITKKLDRRLDALISRLAGKPPPMPPAVAVNLGGHGQTVGNVGESPDSPGRFTTGSTQQHAERHPEVTMDEPSADHRQQVVVDDVDVAGDGADCQRPSE
jgi:hypothetical protein